MSSEAITQNDLREILSRTVGSIPSEYVVEQGANYRKWDSGTMEQWGVEATATSSNHAVSFPKAFISTNYIVVGTNTSGTQANFMTSNTSASSFYVYPSASTKLFWIAIGKWK